MSQCPRCKKNVYLAEEVLCAGQKWHKSCFACKVCSKRLDSTTCADRDGEIFCKSCYAKDFGPKGVGFGQGAGVLSTENGRSSSSSSSSSSSVHVGSAGAQVGDDGCLVNASTGSNGECPRCGKAVYMAEKVIGAGKSWHKSCFACADAKCKKTLDSTTVADNNGQIYCKACHAKRFGPKGVGYGQGAGALAHAQ